MHVEFRSKCRACEILEAELATTRTEKDLLLRKLFELMENKNGQHIENKKDEEKEQVVLNPLPQPTKWSAQLRAQLEAQDRELARRLEEDRRNKIIAMEKQAGIEKETEKEKESANQ